MNSAVKQWLLITAIMGALIVSLAPAPKRSERVSASADSGWLLPRVSVADERRSAAIVSDLARAPLWGADSGATQQDLRQNQWRIAGITGRAKERAVLVQYGDDRIVPMKAGYKFPDGTPIVEVRDNGVCVMLSGKQRLLPLNGQTIPIVW
jgi:hypothetical protein